MRKLVGLTLAAVLLLSAPPVLAQKKILIGSTSASSSHYGYFVAVSNLINEKVKGVNSSVVETGATVDNLRRITRKQVDLGLVTTNILYYAYNGLGAFAKAPVKSGLLWVYNIAPQNVVVRADAKVEKLADLNGKPFNPGIKGSATEKTTEQVFKLLGVAPKYVRGSTTDMVDAIKDNRVIGYVKSGAGLKLDSSTVDIATFTPVKLLSLSQEQRDKLAKEVPELSLVDVPAGAGKGVPAYATWGFAVGCSAGLDLDEETAYQVVKAVCEDKTAQAAAMADVKGVDLADMTLTYATSPLHPGAVRYFKEKGLKVPDKLVAK